MKHQILPKDHQRRMMFCNWFLGHQPSYFENLILTDEAAFMMNGTVNTQNPRHWSPNQSEENWFETNMQRTKLSLWAGVCGNWIVLRQFLYAETLTGEGHAQMIWNLKISPVREVYGNWFKNTWFMHCGAPANRRIAVKNKYWAVFANGIIDLGFDV